MNSLITSRICGGNRCSAQGSKFAFAILIKQKDSTVLSNEIRIDVFILYLLPTSLIFYCYLPAVLSSVIQKEEHIDENYIYLNIDDIAESRILFYHRKTQFMYLTSYGDHH